MCLEWKVTVPLMPITTRVTVHALTLTPWQRSEIQKSQISLIYNKRGGKEWSRSVDTMVQTMVVGGRFHVHYTSTCSDARWEVPPERERSSLHCQAAPTPLPLSPHCHGNVSVSNEK